MPLSGATSGNSVGSTGSSDGPIVELHGHCTKYVWSFNSCLLSLQDDLSLQWITPNHIKFQISRIMWITLPRPWILFPLIPPIHPLLFTQMVDIHMWGKGVPATRSSSGWGGPPLSGNPAYSLLEIDASNSVSIIGHMIEGLYGSTPTRFLCAWSLASYFSSLICYPDSIC